MVAITWCDNKTLQTQIDSNFNENFEGEPPAQAYCCNWNFCNYNITFATMDEPPPDLIENIGMALNYSIILILFNSGVILVRFFI